MTNPRIVKLDKRDIGEAWHIGRARHYSNPSRPLISGGDRIRNDVLGVMAELAVARFYGVDVEEIIKVYDERPNAIPDLRAFGCTISVKSTERWREPLTLFASEHDHNDVFILVSVDLDLGKCGLQGWIMRRAVLDFPLQHPKPDYPGLYRYVPVAALRPCREDARV